MAAEIRIEGMETVIRNLQAYVPRTHAKARQALNKSGESMKDGIKPETPIQSPSESGGHPPGTLQDSITKSQVAGAGDELKIEIGPSKKGFFGYFLEFGTSHQDAMPWMGPAFELNKGNAQRIAIDVLKELFR